MKKTISIILLVLIMFSLFVPKKTLAANATTGHTIQETQLTIANWSIAFYETYRDQCVYSSGSLAKIKAERSATYKMKQPFTTSDVFRFDCVGWVSFAIHQSTGIGNDTFTYFATPQNGVFTENGVECVWEGYTRQTQREWAPGDILIIEDEAKPHVGLYIGSGEVIDIGKNIGLRLTTVENFAHSDITKVARITEETARNANFEFMEGGAELPSYVDLDEGGFEFNGLPKTVSMSPSKGISWLFDLISQFFSYLVGMIINILKASILGYCGLAQTMIDTFLDSSAESINSGQVSNISYAYVENIDYEIFNNFNIEEKTYSVMPIEAMAPDSSSSSEEEEDDGVYTIEDIIYNKVPLLDVNVFSDTPGGQEVPEDSIVEILRKAVATWYVSFRNLAIIALAIIIIYIGIRIALSTIPEEKGNYKTALGSWVISIVLVFVIHYFMLLVLNVNEFIVDLIKDTNLTDVAIYETIQTRAMDIRMQIGIPATIMYVVLIIYLFRFLWVYVKRYFTVMILIIISPFICAKYAFDAAKGKRGTSLSSWMYEFAMNVLLQSVHALVYTVLMGVAIEMAVTSVWGFVLALVFINFILKADKIFLEIFNFGRAKSIEDVDKGFSKEDIAGAIVVGSFAKRAGVFAWNRGKSLVGATRRTGNAIYNKRMRSIYGDNAFEEIKKKKEAKLRKLNAKEPKKLRNKVYRFFHHGKDSDKMRLRMLSRQGGEVGRAAKRTLQKRKDLKKKRYKSNFGIVKAAAGILGMGLAIPAFVTSPKTGYAMMTTGFKQYRSISKPKSDVNGVRGKFHGVEKLAQIGTLGVYGAIQNREKETKKHKKKMGEVTKTIKYLEDVDACTMLAESQAETIFKSMTEQEKTDAVKKIKSIVIDGNNSNISRSIHSFMNVTGENEVTDSNLEQIVDHVMEDLEMKSMFTDAQISTIKADMESSFRAGNLGTHYVQQVTKLSEELHARIVDVGFDSDKAQGLAVEINNIELINQRARKDIKQPVVDTESILRNIRVRNVNNNPSK